MVVLSNGILPDPEAVRKLMVEYNMTPQSVRRDVAHIRQWMEKQPHLPRIPSSKDGIKFYFQSIIFNYFH